MGFTGPVESFFQMRNTFLQYYTFLYKRSIGTLQLVSNSASQIYHTVSFTLHLLLVDVDLSIDFNKLLLTFRMNLPKVMISKIKKLAQAHSKHVLL